MFASLFRSILILAILAAHSLWARLCAQDQFFSSVVNVKTQNAIGQFIEIGSGVIFGAKENQVYILTPLHVVEFDTLIYVQFWQTQEKNYQATRLSFVDQELDLAVLVVNEIDFSAFRLPSLRIPDFASIKLYDKLTCVNSRRNDRSINPLNVVLDLDYELGKLSISNIGIAPGFSGSAIFQRRAFVGMLIEKSSENAVVVRSDIILNWLQGRHLPTNCLFFSRRIPKAAYASLGSSVALLTLGLITKNQVRQNYSLYSIRRIEWDPVYDEIPRTEQFRKANQQQKIVIMSMAASGIALSISTILYLRRNRRASVFKNISIYPGYQEIPLFAGTNSSSFSLNLRINY